MAAPADSAASARPASPEQRCCFDSLDDHLLGLILSNLPARQHRWGATGCRPAPAAASAASAAGSAAAAPAGASGSPLQSRLPAMPSTSSRSPLPRRAAASLVCKRWRRVCFDAPAAWRSLWLGPGTLVTRRASFSDWLAGKHRLLQLVGRHIAAVSLDDTWGAMSGAASAAPFTWHIGRLLNPRRLPSLRQLTLFLDQPDLVEHRAACRALGSLTGLTRLSIVADWLPALTAAALSSLTALRDVSCRARYLPEGLPAAISRLPLTSLCLDSCWEVLPTQPLNSLSHLRTLILRCEAAGLQLPHPGRFSLMRCFVAEGSSLSVISSKFSVSVAGYKRPAFAHHECCCMCS